MNTLHAIKLFAISYPTFIIFDIMWIGILMNSTYQYYLEPIARIYNGKLQANWPAALLVWALIVIGAIIFVLPKTTGVNLIGSFAWGALYGLILYGVYDLTNFAILAQWPLTITIIDIIWGMTVNGILLVLLTWVDSYLA